jgi:hypothetical protein
VRTSIKSSILEELVLSLQHIGTHPVIHIVRCRRAGGDKIRQIFTLDIHEMQVASLLHTTTFTLGRFLNIAFAFPMPFPECASN